MISYCIIKNLMEDGCDYEDLVLKLLYLLITIPLDILFIILQPILYLVVKAFEKENYND